jgi:hypothetical protein
MDRQKCRAIRVKHSHFCTKGLTVFMSMVFFATGCRNEMRWPEAAPTHPRREHDDWLKPGTKVQLRGVVFQSGNESVRISNYEPFALTLLDDVWLTISAPNVEMRHGGPYILDRRHAWFVYLRCPTARKVPAGANMEIQYNQCLVTTFEPGAGARLIGYRLVAREGYVETHIEGGPEIIRSQK